MFQALLGDKYGSVPLITEIPEKEFDVIHDVAVAKDFEADLLGQSYLKDDNASPVVYRIHVRFFFCHSFLNHVSYCL